MKLKTTLFLTLIAIGLFWGVNRFQSTQKPVHISGAYEALNFLGNRQTFPAHEIPSGAYSKAWNQMKRMSANASLRNEVDPWETMGPHNRAGRMLTMTFNPQNDKTLYAGSASGGLWRSYTAGVGINAWERVHFDYPVLGVSSIEFAPQDSMTMYIGTGEVYNYYEAGTGAAFRRTRGSFGIGILKSEDGGQSWTKSLDWSQDENHGVWAIRVAPDNPNNVFAATTQGIYKSIDAGTSWELKLDVIMANDLIVHPLNPKLLVAVCGNLGSDNSGVYRSKDGGESWTEIISTLPDFMGKGQLAFAVSSPNIVYLSLGNSLGGADEKSWLYRSDDFGENWELKNTTDYSMWQGWFSHDVAVDPTNPDNLTIIGINVWTSSNGGEHIVRRSVGGTGYDNAPIKGPDGPSGYVHSDAHDVVYASAKVIYIASDGGIHRSLNGGLTFSSCNSGLQTVQFYNGFSNSQQNPNICMGGLQDNGTIYWNGDLSWKHVGGGDGSWSAIDPIDDDVVYTSSQYLNVVKWWNNFFSFKQQGLSSSNTVFIAPFIISPSDPEVLYAGSSKVMKTENGGNDWDFTGGGPTLDENKTQVLSMAMSYVNSDIVYVATAPFYNAKSKIFRTLNGGDSWDDITQDNPNRFPMDMAVDPSNDAIAYITYAGFGSGHVFRTDDHGDTWTDITNGLPDIPTNAVIVDPLFPETLYVGNDLGVFVSIDSGESWEIFQTGITEAVMIFDLKISPSNRKLRMATHGSGAFERDLINQIDVNVAQISSISEIQIFPNPTTDFVHIKYNLLENSDVNISLVNSLGQNKININKEHNQIGKHEMKLDLNSYSKGIYYLVFEINGDKWSRKVILQ